MTSKVIQVYNPRSISWWVSVTMTSVCRWHNGQCVYVSVSECVCVIPIPLRSEFLRRHRRGRHSQIALSCRHLARSPHTLSTSTSMDVLPPNFPRRSPMDQCTIVIEECGDNTGRTCYITVRCTLVNRSCRIHRVFSVQSLPFLGTCSLHHFNAPTSRALKVSISPAFCLM